ncbi:MAG: hypothetical protein JHC95_23895, partial [Solirubrobacteraceae bacterium]|nr:hypothetical protein [Solirubrobacteraceae bacterium]
MPLLSRLRSVLRREAPPASPLRRGGRDVIAPDVPKVYETFLGREATERELAASQGRDLHDIAARVAGTSEHRKQLRSGKVTALVSGSKVALATHPVGTASPDDVAVVGRDGWLFIARGANDFVRQVTGEVPLPETSLTAWRGLLETQRAAAEKHGVRLVQLVIPDKLAVYRDRFPEDLAPVGPRPVEQLLEGGESGLLYPLEELRVRRDTE